MTGRIFEAWALPSGVARPDGPASEARAGAARLALLDLEPRWIHRLVSVLGDARDALASYRAVDLADRLGRVGARFLDRGDSLRGDALEWLGPSSGLSREMAEVVLDGMAADWTGSRLRALLAGEVGEPSALDRFVVREGRRARAVGPSLCVQVASGSVAGVGASALVRSLLVKSPTLLKPGLGDVILPVLFARALREEDAAIADAAAVVYWPGGREALEDAALRAADAVVAYGGDEVVGGLRRRAPVTARFVGYHHRVSFGIVGRGALAPGEVERAATDVARAVSVFDQRGCVSPRVVYAEEGGRCTPGGFAAALGEALAELEARLPSGVLDPVELAALHQERGTAELLAASHPGVEVRHGGGAPWTVIHDPAPAFTPGCVGRVVRVKPVEDALRVPELVRPFRAHLQTVGVAGLGARLGDVAEALAAVGASRVAPFRDVPFPPATWHHDGQGPLVPLLRWVDLDA